MATATKSDVGDWETVATYVSTFPDGDEDGACDVEIQVGSVTAWTVLQIGRYVGGLYTDRDEAQAEADELNEEAEEELGREVIGDGAVSVHERTVWFIRTTDDAGGSDEADSAEYDSYEEAVDAAEDFADAHEEAEPGEDAVDYLMRKTTERAGSPDPLGEFCVYWETSLEDAGPRERYATREQAQAAAYLAEAALEQSLGRKLLCGFSVRQLVDGEWVAVDGE